MQVAIENDISNHFEWLSYGPTQSKDCNYIRDKFHYPEVIVYYSLLRIILDKRSQRYITIDIAPQSDLVYVAPGNLFLRLTTEQQTSAGAGMGTAAALAVADVKKSVTLTPVLASGSVVDTTTGNISLMELAQVSIDSLIF